MPKNGPLFRRAHAADAPAISALYHEAYNPGDQDAAGGHYPFPQFFHPRWVAAAVVRKNIRWLVAEAGGEVIGSAGALVNIGSPADLVAETFGLVVREQNRAGGIGGRLFQALCRSLEQETCFIIAETRTAHSGGWKIVRNCGFIPIGFEPFAHAMPEGSEPMLLTGRIHPRGLELRQRDAQVRAGVLNLAQPVLSSLALPSPTPADLPELPPQVDPEELLVRRDDSLGQTLLNNWGPHLWHGSGVIGFRRLQGEDLQGKRYDYPYFIGSQSGRPTCCARLVLDRLDRRLRFLELASLSPRLPESLIAAILRQTLSELGNEPLTIVIDVSSQTAELQQTLEKLSFFPTAYYPALIAAGPYRLDAVQYTYHHLLKFQDSLKMVHGLDWPPAQQILQGVSALAT